MICFTIKSALLVILVSVRGFERFGTMADDQRVHPKTKNIDKNTGYYANEKPSSPLAPNYNSLSSQKGGQMRVQFPRDQVIPT